MPFRPVTHPSQVESNIRTFVREIASNRELQSRLSRVHAWYALRDETGGWLFGPSKFVGYADNTAEQYLRTKRAGADGRETEHALARWYSAVDPASGLGRELNEALAAFLARWGRTPRHGARISIVSDEPVAVRASGNILKRISVDPAVCGGRPCIKGTRMRVSDIVDMVATGATRQEILEDYPYLADEDISAALTYAARATDHRVVRAA